MQNQKCYETREKHARDAIEKFFAHLKSKDFIKSFEWRKNGGKFDAITFSFSPL